MLHLGEGRLEESWIDIQAMHALAALSAQDHTLIELLVSMAIENMACRATVALLSDDRLTEGQARQILTLLTVLPRTSRVADAVDHIERLTILDAVLTARVYGPDVLTAGGGTNNTMPWKDAKNVDWNIVLSDINVDFDHLVAASPAAWVDRTAACDRFETDCTFVRRSFDLSGLLLHFIDRKTRSHMMADIFARLMMPALSAASEAEARVDTQLDLVRLAAAPAVYRAQHHAYPESLAALAPEIFPTAGRPLSREAFHLPARTRRLFALNTAGPNGQDDGGSHQDYNILAGRRLDELPDEESFELFEQIPPAPTTSPSASPAPPSNSPRRPAIRKPQRRKSLCLPLSLSPCLSVSSSNSAKSSLEFGHPPRSVTENDHIHDCSAHQPTTHKRGGTRCPRCEKSRPVVLLLCAVLPPEQQFQAPKIEPFYNTK